MNFVDFVNFVNFVKAMGSNELTAFARCRCDRHRPRPPVPGPRCPAPGSYPGIVTGSPFFVKTIARMRVVCVWLALPETA